jgi:hypothetical protein
MDMDKSNRHINNNLLFIITLNYSAKSCGVDYKVKT